MKVFCFCVDYGWGQADAGQCHHAQVPEDVEELQHHNVQTPPPLI
jgi:hypothetical protein